MSLMIFRTENNSAEEWLRLNDDGTVTHHIESSGWSMTKSGTLPREERLTAEAAKVRWPTYAEKIDEAMAVKSEANPNDNASRNF